MRDVLAAVEIGDVCLAYSKRGKRKRTALASDQMQEDGVIAVLAAVVFHGQALPPCVLHEGKPAGLASCYAREPGELVIWHAVAPGVFVRICRSEREGQAGGQGSARSNATAAKQRSAR